MHLKYGNVSFMKVNTLQALEIKDKHADDGKKPYFKFYKDAQILEEVAYEQDWEKQMPKVLEKIKKYSEEYKPDPVRSLTHISDFERAIIGGNGRVICIQFLNTDGSEPEKSF